MGKVAFLSFWLTTSYSNYPEGKVKHSVRPVNSRSERGVITNYYCNIMRKEYGDFALFCFVSLLLLTLQP